MLHVKTKMIKIKCSIELLKIEVTDPLIEHKTNGSLTEIIVRDNYLPVE